MRPETAPLSRPTLGSDSDARLLGARLRRPPRVVAREVGEWLMLIDVDTGFTYEANRLRAQVWRLLADGHCVSEACAVVSRLHDQSREAIESEVLAFVTDLLGYGLASAEASAPAPEVISAER